jgi:hypothetical protein
MDELFDQGTPHGFSASPCGGDRAEDADYRPEEGGRGQTRIIPTR